MKSRNNTKEKLDLCENHLLILKKRKKDVGGDFRQKIIQNYHSMVNKEQRKLREKSF
jgi:hypothetical protein